MNAGVSDALWALTLLPVIAVMAHGVLTSRSDIVDTSETSLRIVCALAIVSCLSLCLVWLAGHAARTLASSNSSGWEAVAGWSRVTLTVLPVGATGLSYLLFGSVLARRLAFLGPDEVTSEGQCLTRLVPVVSRQLGLDSPPLVLFSHVLRGSPRVYKPAFGRALLAIPSDFTTVVSGVADAPRVAEVLTRFALLHELAHIKNRDVVFYTWASCFSGIWPVWVLSSMLVPLFKTLQGPTVLSTVTILRGQGVFLVPLLLLFLLYRSVMRERELLADARARLHVSDADLSLIVRDGGRRQGSASPLARLVWIAGVANSLPRGGRGPGTWQLGARDAGAALSDSVASEADPSQRGEGSKLVRIRRSLGAMLATHPSPKLRSGRLLEAQVVHEAAGVPSVGVWTWVGLTLGLLLPALFLVWAPLMPSGMPRERTTQLPAFQIAVGLSVSGCSACLMYFFLSPLRNAGPFGSPALARTVASLLGGLSWSQVCAFLAMAVWGALSVLPWAKWLHAVRGAALLCWVNFVLVGVAGSAAVIGFAGFRPRLDVSAVSVKRTLGPRCGLSLLGFVGMTPMGAAWVSAYCLFARFSGKAHAVSVQGLALSWMLAIVPVVLGLVWESRNVEMRVVHGCVVIRVRGRVRKWPTPAPVGQAGVVLLHGAMTGGLVGVMSGAAWWGILQFGSVASWPNGSLVPVLVTALVLVALASLAFRRPFASDDATRGLSRLVLLLTLGGRGHACERGPDVVDTVRDWACSNGAFGMVEADYPVLEDMYWAMQALERCGQSLASDGAMLDWLRGHQDPCGGFAEIPGARPTLRSTYHAVTVLEQLEKCDAISQEAVRAWILSRQEDSGGFRSPEHRKATVEDTYHAVMGLSAIGGLADVSRMACIEWLIAHRPRPFDFHEAYLWVSTLQTLGGFSEELRTELLKGWIRPFLDSVVNANVQKQLHRVADFIELAASVYQSDHPEFSEFKATLEAVQAHAREAAPALLAALSPKRSRG